jgi:CheY-like chemotaxis protein
MIKNATFPHVHAHKANQQAGQQLDTKPRILIVDDDEGIVAVLRDGFEADGWTVCVAPDGAQALVMMSFERFDAVMSDLHMPKMNGLELLYKIKTKENNRSTKFCLLSGMLNQEDLKKATSLGVAHVVVKPFAIKSVTKKVREVCVLSEPKTKLSYDTSIIRSIINATEEVCNFYLGESVQFGKPYIKTDSSGSGCLTAVISLARHEALGSVAFSCDGLFFRHLATKLFGDHISGVTSDMIRDMGGEICNQITGKIKINLSRNSYHIQIGLPQVIMGKGHSIEHLVNSPVLRIPMTCKGCELAIEFAMSGNLREGQENQDGTESQSMRSDVMMFDS